MYHGHIPTALAQDAQSLQVKRELPEANRDVKNEEEAQKEADTNLYDRFGYGKIVEKEDMLEHLPLWGKDIPSIGVRPFEKEPCVNLDLYDEYAQAFDMVIAQILRRYYGHYRGLCVEDGPSGHHMFRMKATETGEAPVPKDNCVDYTIPYPFLLTEDGQYIREPTEEELKAFWKKNVSTVLVRSTSVEPG